MQKVVTLANYPTNFFFQLKLRGLIDDMYSSATRIIVAYFMCVALCFTNNALRAQRVMLKGRILADSGAVPQDCYEKVAANKAQRILAFFNTGKNNGFVLPLVMTERDSITITVSRIGYKNAVITVGANAADTVFVEIKMQKSDGILEGVTVKAPPVWKRGNTTFYKADAFKEGSETKLKDLITKMPGFEIDDKGNLLYKKKLVEKILIDGEELFADKIKLLLNNFPVHVLNTIQAIENQTNNPLLKGLGYDSKVFVNLGLNQEKLKAAFGAGEAGIGTDGKYSVNPVIFSLYGKTKFGMIANWDNIGNGIGAMAQNELKTDDIRLSERWAMATDQLRLVNNLESRRYITNGQKDNRLQIDRPFGKKVKSKTEISALTDNLRQRVYNNSALYRNGTFIHQADTDQISNKPYILSLRQQLYWAIDSTQSLNTDFYFYHDRSKSNSQHSYSQEGTASSTQNEIANNFNSFSVNTNYTHRKNIAKAVKWSASATRLFSPQTAQGLSHAWPTVFNLPNPAYTVLQQQVNNILTTGRLGEETIKKTSTGLFTTGIDINTTSVSLNTCLYLTSLGNTLGKVLPQAYNNRGYYNVTSLSGYTKKSIRLLKLPILLHASYGISTTSKHEDSLRANFVSPVFSLALNAQNLLGKKLNDKLNLSYSQQQTPLNQLYSILLPTTVNSFNTYVNTGPPLKVLSADYSLGCGFGHGLFNTTALIFYKRNYSGLAQTSILNQFVQTSAAAFITRPTNDIFINLGGDINVFKGRRYESPISISMGMNLHQAYFTQGNQLRRTDWYLYYANLGLRRNWGNVYFLSAEVWTSRSVYALPQYLQNSTTTKLANIRGILHQRVAVSKRANVLFNTEWLNNNAFTAHDQTLLFLDAEVNYSLPKKHMLYIMRLNSIANEHYYRSFDASSLYQTYYTIPLVGRNMFLSVRYQF